MSRGAMLEMAADWRGAGQALGKLDTLAWYKANKDKMILNRETRAAVEELLGIAVMIKSETCKNCKGTGKLTFWVGIHPKTITVTCDVCGGVGWIKVVWKEKGK
jgi:DnaJ-class molecular chaperone